MLRAISNSRRCLVAASSGRPLNRTAFPRISKTVNGGDTFELAKRPIKVFACPGHTAGHVAYHFSEDYALFAADTLFAMGCAASSRHAEQMHHSVNQFRT